MATGAGGPASTSFAERTLNGSAGFAFSSRHPAHGQFARRCRQVANVATPSAQSMRSPSPSRRRETGFVAGTVTPELYASCLSNDELDRVGPELHLHDGGAAGDDDLADESRLGQ